MSTRLSREFDYKLEAEIRHALLSIDFSPLDGNQLTETASQTNTFPFALWKSLADHGLLRRFTPSTDATTTEQNKLPCRDIARTAYLMTRHHRALGLTMTWVGQLLKSHFLHKLYNDDRCYEALINGDSLCALAISEPNVGAHPKHLTLTATHDENIYVLNGEKAFVSHGPYADFFIVLAITDQSLGRKSYSAFLVAANNSGLRRMPQQPLKGLQPSRHCNIVFKDCRISADCLIGTPGLAFEQISLPMRTLEDVLMLAPIAGAMQAQLDYLAQINAASDSNTKTPAHHKPIDVQILGQLLSLTESAKELGIIAASRLDQQTSTVDLTPRIDDLTPLIVGFRSLVQEAQSVLLEWHDEHPVLRELGNDIQILNNIGRQATAARTGALARRFIAEKSTINTRPTVSHNR